MQTPPPPRAPYVPPRPVYVPVERPRASSAPPPGWLKSAPVSRAILFLNVAIFVVQIVHAGLGHVFESIFSVPPHESLLFGANYAPATLHEGRWETLVTACFLHGGIIHIGFNMWVLLQAGPLVENSVGSARMAPMYLVSGVIASLASSVWIGLVRHEETYSVGASGAIMGVLASAFVLAWRIRGFKDPMTQSLIRWVIFNIAFGVLMSTRGGNIDNAAHIGGAAAGALIAATWRRGFVYTPGARTAILTACGTIVALAFAMVGFRDATDDLASRISIERLEIAHDALADGRCNDAKRALARTKRLDPRDPRVLGALEEIDDTTAVMCGR